MPRNASLTVRETGEEVCAIIVACNPASDLYDNVQALVGQVAAIVVVDNASNTEWQSLFDRVREVPRTEIIHSGTNLGVGAALNVAVQRAIQLGFSWVATFDQDSLASPVFIAEMLRAYTEYPGRENVALIAPQYREKISGLFHQEPTRNVQERILTTSMMSGNLVRTDVIAEVGYYNEDFFIDYIDHEFCLRLARRGFRVLECPRAVLQHNLGRISQKKLMGITLTTTNHSPLRRYYNARNRIFVYRSYVRAVPGWVARDVKSFLVETAKILLIEQDRGAKLRSVARGVWHGLIGVRGRAPRAHREVNALDGTEASRTGAEDHPNEPNTAR